MLTVKSKCMMYCAVVHQLPAQVQFGKVLSEYTDILYCVMSLKKLVIYTLTVQRHELGRQDGVPCICTHSECWI